MEPEADDTDEPGGTGTAFSCPTCNKLYSSAMDAIACSQRHG
jgi:hypothetical protein